MLLKWTESEDLELKKIIRKHGTSDWALIRKHFKSNRSRDSVIKRWHGKLKFDEPQPETLVKTKKIANDRRRDSTSKRSRGGRKGNPPGRRRDRRQPPTPPSGTRRRFQRLRNFVEGAKAERQRRAEREEEKAAMAAAAEKGEKGVERAERTERGGEKVTGEPDWKWNKSDDDRLLAMVLHEGVTSWGRIGSEIGCSEGQARSRWQQAIYNTIKLDDKVGGFHKYSAEEDSILSLGHRNGLSWGEIMTFLPGRTEFSIEARWRRLLRPELEVELSKNKHYIYREFLKKLVEKKRAERHPVEEPPSSEQQPKPT